MVADASGFASISLCLVRLRRHLGSTTRRFLQYHQLALFLSKFYFILFLFLVFRLEITYQCFYVLFDFWVLTPVNIMRVRIRLYYTVLAKSGTHISITTLNHSLSLIEKIGCPSKSRIMGFFVKQLVDQCASCQRWGQVADFLRACWVVYLKQEICV